MHVKLKAEPPPPPPLDVPREPPCKDYAVGLLQDFVKQVASSPLRMDKDDRLHSDTDAIQQMKRSKLLTLLLAGNC